ncbi:MAG: tripartite tricarboxylate transporter substrate binding protein [Pseudomonadota bacterium]
MRALLRLCAAVALAAGLATTASAEAWPGRPIKLINGFVPGGSSDLLARFLADRLGPLLGQPVIVEPHTGAGGLVAGQLVAQAEPDGYTLLQVTMGMLSISPVMPGIPMTFDPDKDLTPVFKTAGLYNVLIVDPRLPITTIAELIGYARANPGKLTYGSAGNGSSQHLSAELFKSLAGIDLLHIPYRGSTPAMTDVIGGRVSCMFTNLSDVLPQVQAGQLRAVAYGSIPGSPLAPAPTIAESGVPEFRIDNWYGIAAPHATPPAIVERLNREMNRIVATPDGQAVLERLGFMPLGGTIADFGQTILRDRAKWARLIESQGIRAE